MVACLALCSNLLRLSFCQFVQFKERESTSSLVRIFLSTLSDVFFLFQHCQIFFSFFNIVRCFFSLPTLSDVFSSSTLSDVFFPLSTLSEFFFLCQHCQIFFLPFSTLSDDFFTLSTLLDDFFLCQHCRMLVQSTLSTSQTLSDSQQTSVKAF